MTHQELSILAHQIETRYLHDPERVVDVLTRLGASGARLGAGEIRSTCPIHRGENPRNFAVFFSREVPIWMCFSDCADSGRLPKLVQRVCGCDFPSAVATLAQWAGLHLDLAGAVTIPPEVLEDDSIRRLNRSLGIDESGNQQPNYFPESMVAFSLQRRHPYFLERGFSQATLDYYQVGFVPAGAWTWPDPKDPSRRRGWLEDRISIPWRDPEGRLIGFAGRRTDSLKLRKYLTLDGTRKGHSLYGLWNPAVRQFLAKHREAVLVEGYPDVWRGHELGFLGVLGVGGVDLSAQQLSLLASLGLRKVTTYFDGDDPGQSTAARMARKLTEFTAVHNATPPQGKDPDDLRTPREFGGPIHDSRPVVAA